MRRADVVVVGGGPAGLSTAGALAALGRHAVVLERDDLGGRWASRYDGLRLHTVRRFSGLAHLPIPPEEGRYVSKDGFARYLCAYAEQLGLDVRARVEVSSIRPRDELWELETAEGPWLANAVVVATGRYDVPVLPAWPGIDGYRGRLLHSAAYRSPSEFLGTSILVVGIGNSGAEIAGELAAAECRVAIAVRSVPPITPREVAGIPVHVLGLLFAHLPPGLVDRVGAPIRRMRVGDLRPYGLDREEWGPFTARKPPVIDVGFLAQLKAGRIEVKPALEGLSQTGATFEDGTSASFDAVIAATGFRTRLPELLDVTGLLDEAGLPIGGRAPRGLHFVGFRDSVRGGLYEIASDSRATAQRIAADLP